MTLGRRIASGEDGDRAEVGGRLRAGWLPARYVRYTHPGRAGQDTDTARLGHHHALGQSLRFTYFAYRCAHHILAPWYLQIHSGEAAHDSLIREIAERFLREFTHALTVMASRQALSFASIVCSTSNQTAPC